MVGVFLLVIAILLLLVIGIAASVSIVWLAYYLAVGVVVGGLGRLILPGRQELGIVLTILVGIASSILGGVIAESLDAGHLMSFVLSVIVAALILAAALGGRTDKRESAPRE
jgi:uncharacterized membrane protein YeaQ/YmgE (transglycosylase-associated protein family)